MGHRYHQEDTIAAIATPQGNGGVAILRVSGPASISIAERIFIGKVELRDAESHRAYLGKIIDRQGASNGNGEVPSSDSASRFLGEVLATVFRSPKSYTAEDVVEIACHGGHFLTKKILELMLNRGARIAEPGEFTMRAFLNGRLDLVQAEAVAEIIKAKTEGSLHGALTHFRGAFSGRIRSLRQKLVEACSLLELEIDFSEEGIELEDRAKTGVRLQRIAAEITDFLATYERGRVMREGLRLVIVGRPNVGKSTLLNALVNEERAIVTDIPGTTRDVLEEELNIRGVLFRVADTAGLRDTEDQIEQEGVRRTLKHVSDSDVVLFLIDCSKSLEQQDPDLIEHIFDLRDKLSRRKSGMVVALNKADLSTKVSMAELRPRVGEHAIVKISAKHQTGFDELERSLVEASCVGEGRADQEPVVMNLRQKRALQHSLDAVQRAYDSLMRGLSAEFIALDLRAAIASLGEIVGDVTTEDILGNIFSRFCIGK